jgi:hypothetical protein
MHGIIQRELQKFVEHRFGAAAWPVLVAEVAAAGHRQVRADEFPDAMMRALVAAAARDAGTPERRMLEEFGEFIAPHLLRMYPYMIKPAWRTLEVLLHTEQTIHHVVRMHHPGAQPASLRCVRQGPAQVVITYVSERRLCDLARGIVLGIARHFDERVAIDEPTCMHRGASACTLKVRRIHPEA